MNPYVSSHRHIRTTNQRTQQRCGDNTWKKLDRLICQPVLFYMLGLRCPIGLLMIDYCSEGMKDDLAMALSENPVARLKLFLMLDSRPRVLDALLFSGLKDTLTHLTLCLVDTGVGEGVHDANGTAPTGLLWNNILDRMRSLLVHLKKLAHLRVIIHCGFWHVFFVPPATHLNFTHALYNCEAVDLEGFAVSLVCVLPSLQFVFITMSAWLGNGVDVSEHWQVARAWRIAEPANGKPVLEDLSEEAVAAIVREEELVLSDADKVSPQCSLQRLGGMT
ncbi:hypothetical protein V8D89_002739 [Ganoderma adspersum]